MKTHTSSLQQKVYYNEAQCIYSKSLTERAYIMDVFTKQATDPEVKGTLVTLNRSYVWCLRIAIAAFIVGAIYIFISDAATGHPLLKWSIFLGLIVLYRFGFMMLYLLQTLYEELWEVKHYLYSKDTQQE